MEDACRRGPCRPERHLQELPSVVVMTMLSLSTSVLAMCTLGKKLVLAPPKLIKGETTNKNKDKDKDQG